MGNTGRAARDSSVNRAKTGFLIGYSCRHYDMRTRLCREYASRPAMYSNYRASAASRIWKAVQSLGQDAPATETEQLIWGNPDPALATPVPQSPDEHRAREVAFR